MTDPIPSVVRVRDSPRLDLLNHAETLFQLKFTGKTLARQAKKAQKDKNTAKARL
ncbi:hypothetical protein V8E53_004758, partial [Lactarius tabidus]